MKIGDKVKREKLKKYFEVVTGRTFEAIHDNELDPSGKVTLNSDDVTLLFDYIRFLKEDMDKLKELSEDLANRIVNGADEDNEESFMAWINKGASAKELLDYIKELK